MSQNSYPTLNEWLKHLEWKKEIKERIDPLTGEKDNLHYYTLSIEVKASCSISEDDEKNAPEMLKYMRENLERNIEEHIDKLVFNKINQQNRGGFHESVFADTPVVVFHPKYLGDIIKDGVFVKHFDFHSPEGTQTQATTARDT